MTSLTITHSFVAHTDILAEQANQNFQDVQTWAANVAVYANLAQMVTGTYATFQAVSTAIPYDDTIPQNSEGVEILTVSITPKSTTNRLLILYEGNASGTAGSFGTTALFQDSTASALTANVTSVTSVDQFYNVSLVHEMAAGTVSATTFKIRIGPQSGGQYNVNGAGGARKLGGVMNCRLTVIEFYSA